MRILRVARFAARFGFAHRPGNAGADARDGGERRGRRAGAGARVAGARPRADGSEAVAHVRGAARDAARSPRVMPEIGRCCRTSPDAAREAMRLLDLAAGAGRNAARCASPCSRARSIRSRSSRSRSGSSCPPRLPGPGAARGAPRQPDRGRAGARCRGAAGAARRRRTPGAGRSGSPSWSTPRSWASRTRTRCARGSRRRARGRGGQRRRDRAAGEDAGRDPPAHRRRAAGSDPPGAARVITRDW